MLLFRFWCCRGVAGACHKVAGSTEAWIQEPATSGGCRRAKLCAVCSICCLMCMRIHVALQIGDFIGDELRFASEEGQLFHLPRDNHCEVSAGLCSSVRVVCALWLGSCSTCRTAHGMLAHHWSAGPGLQALRSAAVHFQLLGQAPCLRR